MTMDWQSNTITEHQENWWGTQRCRRCNNAGVPTRSGDLRVVCSDCGGSGWTDWAALAWEPWSEIIPGLWVGGHDYLAQFNDQIIKVPAHPGDEFDLVVSMYRRLGFEPGPGSQHAEYPFPDSKLNSTVTVRAAKAALKVLNGYRAGMKVLVRCQAGLNRSSFVAGLAMVGLGFTGEDVVQLIRERRSPWALCNDAYADYLSDDDQVRKTLAKAERSGGIE